MGQIGQNIAVVLEQIDKAAQSVQRNSAEIKLLAASKTRAPEEIHEALEAGVSFFGENRVQEARQKNALCSSRIQWHFIGHLQTNKTREAVALFSMIQSVDSLVLAKMLADEAEKQGRLLDILIEVNVSGEKSKFGVKPGDLFELLEQVNRFSRLRVCGLMTLAPWMEEAQKTRPYFAQLREYRDQAEKELGLKLPELSMGMSHDFIPAIQEGSTLVRIGTAIFGERKKPKSEFQESLL